MPPTHTTSTTTQSSSSSTVCSNNNSISNSQLPMRNNNKKIIDPDYKYKIVDEICSETNLYSILGVEKSSSSEELRRAYINVIFFY